MMARFFTRLLLSSGLLFSQMAPYLLLGFGLAGLLYILIPQESISRHLGGRGFKSIVTAVLVGIPLPLCSCGVLPVAASLRKQGASKPATLSFLVSTPTTGVDSILATYALLGILFAIIRPIAALFAGLFVGVLALMFLPETPAINSANEINACKFCTRTTKHRHNFLEKLSIGAQYAFLEMVGEIGKWIILGVVVGGLIEVLIPMHLVEHYAGETYKGILWMFALGLPMYVCATGSIPIAASLIAKGMSPGAALVFLIAGPASNTVTMGVISKTLGKGALVIYIIAIFVISVILAFAFDFIWISLGAPHNLVSGKMNMQQGITNFISAFILAALILFTLVRKKKERAEEVTEMITLRVPSMRCSHCEKTILQALSGCEGVEEVMVNLKNKTVSYRGNADIERVKKAISDAGYEVKD